MGVENVHHFLREKCSFWVCLDEHKSLNELDSLTLAFNPVHGVAQDSFTNIKEYSV